MHRDPKKLSKLRERNLRMVAEQSQTASRRVVTIQDEAKDLNKQRTSVEEMLEVQRCETCMKSESTKELVARTKAAEEAEKRSLVEEMQVVRQEVEGANKVRVEEGEVQRKQFEDKEQQPQDEEEDDGPPLLELE